MNKKSIHEVYGVDAKLLARTTTFENEDQNMLGVMFSEENRDPWKERHWPAGYCGL